ncbi:hypothetical protein [Actinoplanes sp. NPDC049118]|uniref:hypothetical protein n=1 Tax=Actinoplanes sp. NPDC049118 TaxID=3155769 RepID=UPI003404B72B
MIEINRSLGERQPIVVTSRAPEYTAAVAAGDVLTGAAVLQLQQVPLSVAFDFLEAAVPPPISERWREVRARIPIRDPLGAVLRTPLFVSLARALYDTAGADPRDLLDRTRLPDRSAIERTLIDQFLVQAADRIAGSSGTGDVRKRRSAAVRRYLHTVAAVVRSGGSADASWWRVHRIVPPIVIAALVGGLAVLTLGVGWGGMLRQLLPVSSNYLAVVIMMMGVWPFVLAVFLPPRPAGEVVIPGWARAAPGSAVFVIVLGGTLLAGVSGGLVPVVEPSRLTADVIGLAAVAIGVVWLLSPSWADPRRADGSRRRERWRLAVIALAAGCLVYVLGGIEADVSMPQIRPSAALITFAFAVGGMGLAGGRRALRRRDEPKPRSVASRRRVFGAWGVALAALAIAVTGSRGVRWESMLQVAAAGALFLVTGRVLAAAGPGHRHPRRVAPRLRDAASILAPPVGLGTVIGLAAIVVLETLMILVGGVGIDGVLGRGSLSDVEWEDLWFGAMTGAAIGLLLGLLRWALAPADQKHSANPRTVLHADATVSALLISLPAAIAITLAAGLVRDPEWRWVWWVPGTTLVAMPLAIVLVRTLAWPQYRAAHLWLVMTGRLPVRFMCFLDEARSAGILRQVGSVHQFRHVRLLQHLQAPDTAEPSHARQWVSAAAACLLAAAAALGLASAADIQGPGAQAALLESAHRPDPAALKRQKVCKSACRITSEAVFVHPGWGPVVLVTTAAVKEETRDANIAVTDQDGAIVWQHHAGDWEKLSVAAPTTDRTGNIFLTFNPGRSDGVIVLRPTYDGFDTFGSLPAEGDDDGTFYSATLTDADQDGAFDIELVETDCDSTCAEGRVTEALLYWTGKGYRP